MTRYVATLRSAGLAVFAVLIPFVAASCAKGDAARDAGSASPGVGFEAPAGDGAPQAGEVGPEAPGEAASPGPATSPYGGPKILAVMGTPQLDRRSGSLKAIQGQALAEGDMITTGDGESVDIVFEGFATMRLLPDSALTLVNAPPGRDAAGERLFIDLALERGNVLVEARSLDSGEEFVVSTPNGAASIRGTSFLVGTEGTDAERVVTRVAVSEGRVALLPKGSLLTGLLDGRRTNPLAAAVVRASFAFAPSADAGGELSLATDLSYGAVGNDPLIRASEQVYSTLLGAAEESVSRGFKVDEAEDPRPLIAPSGSEAERMAADAFRSLRAVPASGSSLGLLKGLESLPSYRTVAEPVGLPFAGPPRGTSSSGSAPSGSSDSLSPRASDPAVSWKEELSSAPISSALTRAGKLVLALDEEGRLFAVDDGGSVIWRSPGPYSSVSALSDSLLVARSDGGIVSLSAADGVTIATGSDGLGPAAARTKAIPVPGGAAVAGPRGILLLRAENAELIAEIPVDGGVVATPVLADRILVALTGKGSLAFIDTGARKVERYAQLSLGDCAGLGPRYTDGKLFVADRSGTVIAVDPGTASPLWRVSLGSKILAELEVGSSGVYVWTGDHTVVALSPATGDPIAPPARGAASPPLLASGVLYWTDASGSLVAADPATLIPLWRYDIAAVGAGRPILLDGRLYVGTTGGSLIRVDLSKP